MSDKKKVIEGLEWILEDDRFGFGVNWENGKPRDDYEIAGKIITDAIALLKEQEAVPVIQREVMHMLVWCCGSCGTAITDGDKFCRMCGKPVKWNVRS